MKVLPLREEVMMRAGVIVFARKIFFALYATRGSAQNKAQLSSWCVNRKRPCRLSTENLSNSFPGLSLHQAS